MCIKSVICSFSFFQEFTVIIQIICFVKKTRKIFKPFILTSISLVLLENAKILLDFYHHMLFQVLQFVLVCI